MEQQGTPGALGSNDGLGAACQQSSGMPALEEMAADRYRVTRAGFWWRVAIGDGQQIVGRCYTETEAERLAAALRTAFLDGAFVVAELHRQRNAMRELGEMVRQQSRSRITPAPHA